MPEWRTPDLSCGIFTFAEGMLSPLAHDLEIAVGEGVLSVDGSRVTARFAAASLSVVGTVKGGRTDPGGLSKSDYGKIERSIREEVLHAARHPDVRFEGELSGDPSAEDTVEVKGEFDLHGVRRALRVPVRRSAGGWVAELTIHQPDHGIRPYKALMGTLKVKADVRVRVAIPESAR